jgi:site-specific DNA recombinase
MDDSYQVAEVNGRTTLAIHEPEARIVRLIYEWYTGQGQERAGTRKIAKSLCEMKIPTWGDLNPGKSSKRKARYHWSKASVYRILTNEVYAGVWQYGDIKVQVPAIVERTVWEAAQERRKSNIHEAKRQRKYEYLLSGHVKCKCNVAMVGMTIRTGGKPYSYYVCNTKRSPLAYDRPCGAPYFRVDKVDAKVWARIAGWLEEPEQLEKGLAAYRSQQKEINRPLLERLAVIDGLLEDNRTKLERLLDLFLDGDFDRELLLERKQNLEQIVRSLERDPFIIGQVLTKASTWRREVASSGR